MLLPKNKIVFIVIVISLILFIGAYCILLFTDDHSDVIDHNQVPLPKLVDHQREYHSRLEALNNLKEIRQTTPPSMYDQTTLDAVGHHHASLDSLKKKHLIDSVYTLGQSRHFKLMRLGLYDNEKTNSMATNHMEQPEKLEPKSNFRSMDSSTIPIKEIILEHEQFYRSLPKFQKADVLSQNLELYAYVDGTQMVKKEQRLQMRLSKEITISGVLFPKNTPIYGFLSFKPNRVLITIKSIGQHLIHLTAFDQEDGNEGIYIENSFRAEAEQQLIDDAVRDISIAGIPQVHGIKGIFRRNNRHVKVMIMDNYQLILKTSTKPTQFLN